MGEAGVAPTVCVHCPALRLMHNDSRSCPKPCLPQDYHARSHRSLESTANLITVKGQSGGDAGVSDNPDEAGAFDGQAPPDEMVRSQQPFAICMVNYGRQRCVSCPAIWELTILLPSENPDLLMEPHRNACEGQRRLGAMRTRRYLQRCDAQVLQFCQGPCEQRPFPRLSRSLPVRCCRCRPARRISHLPSVFFFARVRTR